MHPYYCLFFFSDPATTEIYTLSLHDALPIFLGVASFIPRGRAARELPQTITRLLAISGREHSRRLSERSEEHTSELQSQSNLVCRLLLEKKNITIPLPA